MTQYYILEIQKYANGEFGHIVHFAYDENETKARQKGESKYYEILSACAISELPMHSAILIRADGEAIMARSYKHEVEADV